MSPYNTLERAKVLCAYGDHVTGGGYDPAPGLNIRASFPFQGAAASGWQLNSVENTTHGTRRVTVWAVCADLPSAS